MNFIARRTIIKHSVLLAVACALLGYGLYIFVANEERIRNFKTYYLDSLKYELIANVRNVEISVGLRDRPDVAMSPSVDSVPILLYHGITAKADQYSVSYAAFKDQMFALKRNGYHAITLDDYYAFMNREKRLPEKPFLLTFDDGRKDSYYPVDPLLKYLDFHAVQFVITERSLVEDSDYYLTASELKKMSKSGRWDIGVHAKDGHRQIPIDDKGGMGNFFSNKIWLSSSGRLETDDEYRSRLHNELTDAKSALNSTLGTDIAAIAFPFGDYGQDSINYPVAAKQVIADEVRANYIGSFAQHRNGAFTYMSPNYHSLIDLRFEVVADTTTEQLLAELGAGAHKVLPYSSDFNSKKGWLKGWGSPAQVQKGVLRLSANPDNTGSGVFLDGGQNWTNVKSSIRMDSLSGKSVTLMARFKDSGNYLSCTYTASYARLSSNVKGVARTIQEYKFPKAIELAKGADLAIIVHDSKAQCLVGDEVVAASNDIPRQLSYGTIGLSVWDATKGTSAATISSVTVTTQ